MSPPARSPFRTAAALVTSGVLAFAGLAAAAPAVSAAEHHAAATASGSSHVLAYYQTQYSNGAYVSPLPLKGVATDVEVAAFHLNGDGTVHLNDDPPSDPKFDTMWQDVATLQQSGVKVHALLGGAAQGSYANLAKDFEKYYKLLHDTVQTYHLNGVDLDIEETFSLQNTQKLIARLHTDFGTGFNVILTPVATDLAGESSFSGGFSYAQLERESGSQISWYTGQFYCGWGDLGSTATYDRVVSAGFGAGRVVAGTVTNPANCGGYVDPQRLKSTLSALRSKYPAFGGVAGWEYFNAVPVDGTGPASWYAAMGGTTSTPPGRTGPIKGGGSGLCVDDDHSSTANGTKIQIWECNGTGAQNWTVNGNGTLTVLGKCMDVTSSGTANGTKIQLYTCNGTGAQVWRTGDNGSLVNPQSGKCLDNPGASTTWGTQLQIYTCSGSGAQRWTLPA